MIQIITSFQKRLRQPLLHRYTNLQSGKTSTRFLIVAQRNALGTESDIECSLQGNFNHFSIVSDLILKFPYRERLRGGT